MTTARTPAWMNPHAITDITIHCAATPRGRDVKAPAISAMDIARADLGHQIAYHYVIELDGNTVQTLRHDQRGAHTGGHNTGNLGICYVGGVEADAKMTPADTRTPAQKVALAALVRKLRDEFPHVTVRGHRDWPGVHKACPSFDVAAWLATEQL
ncbi:N-acetylmuramoyl-L-alanine amidase [soil metagenome]